MNKTFKKFLDYLIVVLVAVLFVFNYQIFIIKNSFAPAGINGIATMIQYKCGFSIGWFSLIINLPLSIFAYFTINKEFGIKTLIFSLCYSVFYILLSKFDLTRFQYDATGDETIFPCMIAGMISGFGYSVAFSKNASTGGTDIISKYLSKNNPLFNFYWINFIINATVAVISFFVYAEKGANGQFIYDYKPVCLCMLYCFLSSFIGNHILKWSKSATKFTIITPYAKEISEEILVKLKHGVTEIDAVGAYSNESKKVLICLVNKQQLVDFKNIISKYDKTFTFVESATETIGNFKKIK